MVYLCNDAASVEIEVPREEPHSPAFAKKKCTKQGEIDRTCRSNATWGIFFDLMCGK